MAKRKLASPQENVNVTTEGNGGSYQSYAKLGAGRNGVSDVNRLQVVLHSDIIDRYDGMSASQEIWGSKPNPKFLSDTLNDREIRHAVSSFFVERQFARVFKSVLPGNTRTLKMSDCMITKTELHQALIEGRSAKEAGVLMELIVPLFIHFGAISNNIQFSRHMSYDFGRVTVKTIMNEVVTYQVMLAVDKAKTSLIDKTIKYSVSVLAELLADALRPIGLSLLEFADLTQVVDDMVKGVRANIDPTQAGGKIKGSVPSEWRNNPAVVELSQNLVFVKAALSLPPRTVLTPQCELSRLLEWGSIILAVLKSSERFAWVSKAEVLKNYGLQHVRDVKGKVKCAILHREAKVQPVGQTVYAFKDDILKGSFNINPTKDRIADTIRSAYGNASFSIGDGASMVASILSDAIGAGWTPINNLYVFDTNYYDTDLVSIAALLSSRLYVNLDESGAVEAVQTPSPFGPRPKPSADSDDYEEHWSPHWWFTLPTLELDLDIESGTHNGSEITTCDVVEVFLAHQEFSALEPVMPKAQVLGPLAFNSQVVSFNDDLLNAVDRKYTFDVTINDVALRGAFKPLNFASLRSDSRTALVKPHFNTAVIQGTAKCYSAALSILKHLEDEGAWSDISRAISPTITAYCRKKIALSLLNLVQQMDAAFRSEVHEAIISRSLANLPEGSDLSDSILMRAKLARKTFAAAADVIAFDFFLSMQGIQVPVWQELSLEPEMIRVWMETGSNRTLN